MDVHITSRPIILYPLYLVRWFFRSSLINNWVTSFPQCHFWSERSLRILFLLIRLHLCSDYWLDLKPSSIKWLSFVLSKSLSRVTIKCLEEALRSFFLTTFIVRSTNKAQLFLPNSNKPKVSIFCKFNSRPLRKRLCKLALNIAPINVCYMLGAGPVQ